jgi:hypothetical protein
VRAAGRCLASATLAVSAWVVNRGRPLRAVCPRLTMLTLSERWFTTQTSLFDRAATATGSRPTGTRARKTGEPCVRSKISSVPLGVLTAKRRDRSGEIATGRTGPLSKAMKEGPVEEAATCLDKRPKDAHAKMMTTKKTKNLRERAGNMYEQCYNATGRPVLTCSDPCLSYRDTGCGSVRRRWSSRPSLR